MRNMEFRNIAMKWKQDGKSYAEISDLLNISRSSAQNLCKYKLKTIKRKRGQQFMINKKSSLSIKRECSRLSASGEKVNCSKLIRNCSLSVSRWTISRYLRKQDYRYKKANTQIHLTAKHKLDRIDIIRNWITINHDWKKTVFSDEKRFSLDGPDDWSSYIPKNRNVIRQKRICEGGSVMIWMMMLPNGLLSFRLIEKFFNAKQYLCILKETAVPIIKLNMIGISYFQQDNSAIHTAKIIKSFFEESKIQTIQWPARSPDLNIIEDVWKLLSDMVYDGPQYKNRSELNVAIKKAIDHINVYCRDKIVNLYGTMGSRICTVLQKKGGLCNK